MRGNDHYCIADLYCILAFWEDDLPVAADKLNHQMTTQLQVLERRTCDS